MPTVLCGSTCQDLSAVCWTARWPLFITETFEKMKSSVIFAATLIAYSKDKPVLYVTVLVTDIVQCTREKSSLCSFFGREANLENHTRKTNFFYENNEQCGRQQMGTEPIRTSLKRIAKRRWPEGLCDHKPDTDLRIRPYLSNEKQNKVSSQRLLTR